MICVGLGGEVDSVLAVAASLTSCGTPGAGLKRQYRHVNERRVHEHPVAGNPLRVEPCDPRSPQGSEQAIQESL